MAKDRLRFGLLVVLSFKVCLFVLALAEKINH